MEYMEINEKYVSVPKNDNYKIVCVKSLTGTGKT
jgi:hypothetical protein